MRTAIALWTMICALCSAGATNSRDLRPCPLSANGVGPLTLLLHVTVAHGTTTATGKIWNGSPFTVTRAIFNVTGRSGRAVCHFSFWLTPASAVAPGAPATLEPVVCPKAIRGDDYTCELQGVRRVLPQLAGLHTVFVDRIAGNAGDMSRARLSALVVNTGRFRLASSAEAADAVLSGRAETTGTESQQDTSGRQLAGSIAAPSASLSAAADIGHATSSSRWVGNALVLRLVSRSGESIWAWDGTKPCPQEPAACAINDLLSGATGQ